MASLSKNPKSIKVVNPNVEYTDSHIIANYTTSKSTVTEVDEEYVIKIEEKGYTFKTERKQPKLGVMLIGLGGNNGTTFVAGHIANKEKLTWMTKDGQKTANCYGSITQCSTVKVGTSGKEEVFLPLNRVLPTVNPDDIVIGGWDISKMNLTDAMARAKVLDYDLQRNLNEKMRDIVPLPAVYYKDFIALNQESRADNILPGDNKQEHLDKIRQDIRQFKEDNELDKVIILWTANTERFCKLEDGVHDTADNLMNAIKYSHPEISPSTIYACASILEGCSFINGSPQNTLVPGVVQLAESNGVFIVGDDFKSGQTKFKTALIDFLVSAGIKPISIISYNHLGNNDGKNLSSESQFKSKENSKKSCVDDIMQSNQTLYAPKEEIDHTIVIKYAPTAGDTKKALDEYVSEIYMGGKHFLNIYNVCEDSLLAAPIILDLILLTELFERIQWKNETMDEFERFHSVLSTLGYLCKAPLTSDKAPLINSLFRQKNGIENIFKVCSGLALEDNMLLEYRCDLLAGKGRK